MSTTENEFTSLMQRVRAGDAQASSELFERYAQEVQLIVRRRLNKRLRSQFDSLDFAQDAWVAFLDISPESYTFQTPEELVAFLARLARHKLIDAYRQRFHAAKRDQRLVRRIDTEKQEPPARQASPSQFALAEDEWERMLLNKPPKLRKALEMLRDGYKRVEIVEMLGLHPKILQRLIQSLDDRQSSS